MTNRENIHNRSKLTPKKMLGGGAKVILVFVVLAFLGLQSLNFFEFTFPADQWYYAYLGFGLTSGGVVFYLAIFKMDADTKMKSTIAAVMMVVCVIGELLTAGFGMQVEGWRNLGFEMTADDFKFMILAVQVMALFHGFALILYYAGDDLVALFQDEDGDGIPNIIDPDYRRNGQRPVRQMASETESTLDPQGPSRTNHR